MRLLVFLALLHAWCVCASATAWSERRERLKDAMQYREGLKSVEVELCFLKSGESYHRVNLTFVDWSVKTIYCSIPDPSEYSEVCERVHGSVFSREPGRDLTSRWVEALTVIGCDTMAVPDETLLLPVMVLCLFLIAVEVFLALYLYYKWYK